jgi:hypothetical protein
LEATPPITGSLWSQVRVIFQFHSTFFFAQYHKYTKSVRHGAQKSTDSELSWLACSPSLPFPSVTTHFLSGLGLKNLSLSLSLSLFLSLSLSLSLSIVFTGGQWSQTHTLLRSTGEPC